MSAVTGTLTKRTEDDEGSEVTTVVELPHIVQISDTDTVSLTEMPTIIYGAENRFVIDLGTKRSFDLSCKRVNPRDYNDASSDRSEWSNGRWWTWFVSVIDEWQCTMTSDEHPEGGFLLTLDTGDAELFPSIELNVYISGSVSPSFGVDALSFTLPLTVARLTTESYDLPTAKIVFDANNDSGETREVSVPANIAYTLPGSFEKWAKSGYLFQNWNTASDGSGATYEAGDTVTLEEGDELTLYAVWNIGLSWLFDEAGTYEYTVPDGYNYMTVYLVGGGGGAGGRSDSDSIPRSAGGAGGGGGVNTYSYSVTGGIVIECTVGAGGKVGRNHSILHDAYTGSDGGETSISFTDADGNSQFLSAAGGAGGSAGSRVTYHLTASEVFAQDEDGNDVKDEFGHPVYVSECMLRTLLDKGYDIYLSTSITTGYYLGVYTSEGVGGTSVEVGGSSYGEGYAVGENNTADSIGATAKTDAITITFDDGVVYEFDNLYASVAPSGGVPDVVLTDNDGNEVTPYGGHGISIDGDPDDESRSGRLGGGGGGSVEGAAPGFWRDVYDSAGNGGDGAVNLQFFKL